jgi:hypothetical protein
MSYANETYSSQAVLPIQKADQRDRSAFMRTIVAVIDAFQEALEMQRTAYRRFPFNAE